MRTAHEAGARLSDTSPLYGYGRSELCLGQVLLQLPRADFVVSTKVGRWLTPRRPGRSYEGLRTGGLDFVPTYDLTYGGVMHAIEQSHCRLGLASNDILLIHDIDVHTHGREAFERHYRAALEGAYPALDDLRRAGVIKAVGIGINEVEPCLRFARDADLDCVLLAGRYTLLEQGTLDELLPLCVDKRIGISGRRAVQLGHPGAGGDRWRHLQLSRGAARGARAGARDRSSVPTSGCSLGRGRAPVSAGSSRDQLDHPGRSEPRRDAGERPQSRSRHSRGVVGGAQARGLLHPAAPVPA